MQTSPMHFSVLLRDFRVSVKQRNQVCSLSRGFSVRPQFIHSKILILINCKHSLCFTKAWDTADTSSRMLVFPEPFKFLCCLFLDFQHLLYARNCIPGSLVSLLTCPLPKLGHKLTHLLQKPHLNISALAFAWQVAKKQITRFSQLINYQILSLTCLVFDWTELRILLRVSGV